MLISSVTLDAYTYGPCAKAAEPRWHASTPLRSSIVCYLLLKSLLLQDVRRVTNGFNNDWMPSGYRDVKVNPVVNEHLCEIQLHLGDFSVLKSDQHAVYEWARDLRVTTKMRATDLFSTLSSEVTEEMIRLARQDWCGTGYCLPELLLASGQYDQAEEGLRQVKCNFLSKWCRVVFTHASFNTVAELSKSTSQVTRECSSPRFIFIRKPAVWDCSQSLSAPTILR